MADQTLRTFAGQLKKTKVGIDATLDLFKEKGKQLPLTDMLLELKNIQISEWSAQRGDHANNPLYQTSAFPGITLNVDRNGLLLDLGYSRYVEFKGAEITTFHKDLKRRYDNYKAR